MKFFDVKDVVVAHNALGDGFVEGEGGGGYVLFVGTLEPRKNLKELITAMEELWRGGSDLRLKIVGAKGWNEEVKVSGEFERMVEFTGFVSDEELVGLYGAAEVFVFPSFYEGFGIPLLEAMACGVAVISADNSSLREVGGDACVYFDGDLSECIKRVVGDNELKKELRERGLLRCKEFSWKESAKLLYQRSSV
jgi:glycosyltransferase involved in cell wall biosynthesis